MTETPSYKTEKLTITISTSFGTYKILKLIFSKKDGSIFLTFPYFKNSKGIVGICSIPRGVNKTDVNLSNRGKVTSHLIKYSHHLDGNVLFSQDRRIFSRVKKKSKPLTSDAGHIFTIKLQSLNGFETLNSVRPPKDQNLNFHFSKQPEAVQLLGYWYTKSYINSNYEGKISPVMDIKNKNGEIHPGFLVSPLNVNTDSVLIFIPKAIPRLTEESGSHLTFIGGFDSSDIVKDLSKDTSFLGFMYPVSDYEILKKTIGSIDFQDNL